MMTEESGVNRLRSDLSEKPFVPTKTRYFRNVDRKRSREARIDSAGRSMNSLCISKAIRVCDETRKSAQLSVFSISSFISYRSFRNL
jgi:hypothetical protein